jgi:hypothetical protein
MALARHHCEDRLVLVHEAATPRPACRFARWPRSRPCAASAAVDDPFSELMRLQQPSARFDALQRELIDEMAILHRL